MSTGSNIDRFGQCKAHALSRADDLIISIKTGKMNVSAFEGIMRSYLDQPGFDRCWRPALLRLCLTRLDGRFRQ